MVQLPVEGELPSLGGATEWLNSEPSTAVGLRGNVVLINFGTYTCINWLRSLPYVRAWARKYKQHGLVVISVHTPEFAFEHNIDNVRRAVQELQIEHPITVDNNYAIWTAFNNRYWPALYFVEAAADWGSLQSPEMYVGFERTEHYFPQRTKGSGLR